MSDPASELSSPAAVSGPDAPLVEAVERLDPAQFQGELVETEHLARYHWAAAIVPGRTVLDAGSGEGYGCALLAAAGAASCVGVDVAPEAVEHARTAHGSDTVEFVTGDVTKLSFEDASFDVVTCFETIEHVGAQERVVSELARVLRPGGTLLISSPNRGVYPPGNPFHERELTAAEFEGLLGQAFAHVRLMRQHNWIVSAVLDDEAFSAGAAEDLGMRTGKVVGKEPGQELYTLAVCGHSPSAAEPGRLGLLTHGLEVRRWTDELNRRAAQIAELAEVRRALAATEQELLEARDARSVAMAHLERQTYWLERGRIDLDAWMRRRPLRLAFYALTFALRVLRRLRGRR